MSRTYDWINDQAPTSVPADAECCGNCEYYLGSRKLKNMKGLCSESPPQMVVERQVATEDLDPIRNVRVPFMQSIFATYYPQVSAHQHCGKFKRGEVQKTAEVLKFPGSQIEIPVVGPTESVTAVNGEDSEA